MDNKAIKLAIDWFSENRFLYKQLANKVEIIICELLEINNIKIHAIFNRAKELESLKEKIRDSKYTDINQITDLAGIRIICYVESDIPKICKIIEDNFEIDGKNSSDKSKLLGTDKVGYKSFHYVGKLNSIRLSLPEYKNYNGRKFEIQIRTILQHAWAEIEHDRNYKFSGELPEEIQRRFKLVAGSLELADKEFDRIATEIDKISVEVDKGTKTGNLDFDLNTTTLKQFLSTKFRTMIPKYIKPDFPSPESEIRILKELENYGLKTLNDLNQIIPKDFISNIKKSDASLNFPGLLRILMFANDPEQYFEKANDLKIGLSAFKSQEILSNYNIPFEKLQEKYI